MLETYEKRRDRFVARRGQCEIRHGDGPLERAEEYRPAFRWRKETFTNTQPLDTVINLRLNELGRMQDVVTTMNISELGRFIS
ncbi:MAG: hypothetical protein ACLR8Y_13835 [Alistipes indistinctus]